MLGSQGAFSGCRRYSGSRVETMSGSKVLSCSMIKCLLGACRWGVEWLHLATYRWCRIVWIGLLWALIHLALSVGERLVYLRALYVSEPNVWLVWRTNIAPSGVHSLVLEIVTDPIACFHSVYAAGEGCCRWHSLELEPSCQVVMSGSIVRPSHKTVSPIKWTFFQCWNLFISINSDVVKIPVSWIASINS